VSGAAGGGGSAAARSAISVDARDGAAGSKRDDGERRGETGETAEDRWASGRTWRKGFRFYVR
jgi:hypothetical protein